MNIVYFLLNQFLQEEQIQTVLMIMVSFLINIVQTTGISSISATIIDSIQQNQKTNVDNYYLYFVYASVIYILLYYIYVYFQSKLLSKLRQWMRQKLIEMLLFVNNENFSEMNFSKLSGPINRISAISFTVFNDTITHLLPNITFLLIILFYFFYQNRTIGSMFLIGNLLFGLYVFLNWNAMLQYNKNYEKQYSDSESYLVEILNNIDKIIYRGQTKTENNVFSQKIKETIDKAFRFYSNTNFHCLILNIIMFFTIFACLGYIIQMFFKKKLDLKIFITIFTILLLYRDRITTVINQISDFIEFIGRADTMMDHFKNMPSEFSNLPNGGYNDVALDFHTIQFKNVSFKYQGGDKNVLNHFNKTLNINDKIIGIVGLSGNGKSTLTKLLIKMYKCSEGTIYIDGKDIQEIDANYIRANITYVNQNSKLFDRVVVENILYGCYDPDHCKNYLDIIMKYPKINELYRNVDIHNKTAGPSGENLSGGQRQVINLVGGLVMPSPIIILDEPTNALDIELKKEVIQLIKDFKKYKKCIMVITHDSDLFPIFDETVRI